MQTARISKAMTDDDDMMKMVMMLMLDNGSTLEDCTPRDNRELHMQWATIRFPNPVPTHKSRTSPPLGAINTAAAVRHAVT